MYENLKEKKKKKSPAPLSTPFATIMTLTVFVHFVSKILLISRSPIAVFVNIKCIKKILIIKAEETTTTTAKKK